MKRLIALSCGIATLFSLQAQENYKYNVNVSLYNDTSHRYTPVKYDIKDYATGARPKNVIFFIGDGMGITQVFAALTANNGDLYLSQFKNIGFSKTNSADNYVTDSAAGGTALACGKKTRNGMIGMSADSIAIPSLLALSDKAGLATGLIATVSIVHATPASFIAHVPNRGQYEDIALGFLDYDVDVFIGGGRKFFKERKDGRNICKELEKKGYRMYDNLKDAQNDNAPHIGILASDEHMPTAATRTPSLVESTEKAIDILKQDSNGFFMMIEGSQIDWGGHQNDIRDVINETFDLDKAIGKALDFAINDGNTLIVITADHETGGLTVNGGDYKTGVVKSALTTGDHTAVMVPVFAYGPGAEEFRGIYNNTEVFEKIRRLLLDK
jgi:alkaline phosphatase